MLNWERRGRWQRRGGWVAEVRQMTQYCTQKSPASITGRRYVRDGKGLRLCGNLMPGCSYYRVMTLAMCYRALSPSVAHK